MKQVNVSSEVIIQILETLEVPFVRVIEHGLKSPHFQGFVENSNLVPNRFNRMDFGITVFHDSIQLFFPKNENRQNGKIWPMMNHFGGGLTIKRRGNVFKAYSTIAHHLKHRLNFS